MLFLFTLSIIPISIILTNRLLPPYDKNGRVTPVTGIIPVTTIRFKHVWNININERPNTKYFPNKSVVSRAILIDV